VLGTGSPFADVLVGDYNPACRLPVAFHHSVGRLPAFTGCSMKGRTYPTFRSEPLFPFGCGLIYTSFAWRDPTTPKEPDTGRDAAVSGVVNEAPVQPIRTLNGFQRIMLNRQSANAATTAVVVETLNLQGRRLPVN
jgi:beta-glucosidase